MSKTTIDTAKGKFQNSHALSFEESFDIANVCARSLRIPREEKDARDLIIRALDSWDKLSPETLTIWNDIVEASGLYPYLTPQYLAGSSAIRYEFHKSRYLKDVYLHYEQNELSLILQSGKSVVLSAPTSFGKSLLIEEIVASHKYRNIVIIQPTLALLDETRKKLQKYKSTYKILVSTTQEPTESLGNIFLFTAERVVEYSHFKQVDFFVIDEFYKLSLDRDDDRAITLNHAFYKLLKRTEKFYLLGPMIKNIPEEFKAKYEINWHHTEFATVAVDEIDLSPKSIKPKSDHREDLFGLLPKLEDQTLIYCSAPDRATEVALQFIEHLKTNGLSEKYTTAGNEDIIEWLEENIHPKWGYIEALRHSIAVHHGTMPRHLGSSIVDAFNEGSVKYLFCTSTLIEGVNTSAKNVVLFDKRKGSKPIDFFDYRNIAGRSGRMRVHFLGRVFRFHREPEQMELDVDIPIITQNNAPLELLIQLDPKDISLEASKRLAPLRGLEDELVGVIKKNSSVSVEGQIGLVLELETNPEYYHRLMSWKFIPKYEELLLVLNLAWKHLLSPGERRTRITTKQLSMITIRYANLKSIAGLISQDLNSEYWIKTIPEENERVNAVVAKVLQIARHWFDYKLPKLLGAMSNIQKYVFTKHDIEPGDYSYLAAVLENDFLSKEMATLLELDIPRSALRKIQSLFRDKSVSPETILSQLSKLNLSQFKLNAYERKKLISAI